MDCSVVFDIRNGGLRIFWFPSVGLIFVAVGAVAVRFRHQLAANRGRMSLIFPWFFLGFSILWTCGAGIATLRNYVSLRNAVSSGSYEVVEGVVYNFKPMPNEGKGIESFDVAGKHFEYSEADVTSGFNTTSSHGGPIATYGVYVRIWHRRGVILHLEVCRPWVSSATSFILRPPCDSPST